jgi:NTE family protein
MRIFRKKRIGVALSGGSARALAHIGVLEVLESLGVEISAVSGTSMGAIIGSLYCSGVSLKEAEDYVSDMDWKSFLLFTDFAFNKMGIINGKRVEEVLDKFLDDKTFEDCQKDFCCVAADIITQKKVILNSGRLREAVRASISIPGLFDPVRFKDMVLVDGGIIENLPTKAVKSLDVDFIIASSIVFGKENRESEFLSGMYEHMDRKNKKYNLPNYGKNMKSGKSNRKKKEKFGIFKRRKPGSSRLSAYSVLDISFNIIHREMIKSYLKNADIVIEPEVGDYGFFDYVHGSEIIERGRKAAIKKIPEIKKKLHLR